MSWCQMRKSCKSWLLWKTFAVTLKPLHSICQLTGRCLVSLTILLSWRTPWTYRRSNRRSMEPIYCQTGNLVHRTSACRSLSMTWTSFGATVSSLTRSAAWSIGTLRLCPAVRIAFSSSTKLWVASLARRTPSSMIWPENLIKRAQGSLEKTMENLAMSSVCLTQPAMSALRRKFVLLNSSRSANVES